MTRYARESTVRKAAGAMAVLAAALSAGCGSDTQQTSDPPITAYRQVMAPPNLAVAQLGDLAVFEFRGNGGDDVTRRLVSRLKAAQLDGEALFRITGPTRLPQVTRDDKGLIERANAIAFGRKAGARGVLFGEATLMSDVRLEPPAVRRDCARYVETTCVQYRTSTRVCAQVIARLAFTPLVLRVDGGQSLYTPDLRTFREQGRECRSFAAGNAFEAAELLKHEIRTNVTDVQRRLIDRVAEAVFLDIAPQVKTFTVDFLKQADALQGEAADRFNEIAGLARSGRIEEACSRWQQMAQSGIKDLAVTYNLAACAEHRRDFAAALALYEAGYRQIDVAFKVDLQGNPAAIEAAEEHNYTLKHWADLLERSQQRVVELQYSREAMEQLVKRP